MFYSLYTLIVLFSPFLSFVTFFFFFNKEIMGDKLEEEEKKHLPSMMKLKNIYIYTCVLQNKYNIARILSKIFPNGCCKINSRNDERTERVR